MDIKIKKFVKKWMEGHEPDTFIKNEHGVYLYKAGPTSINLTIFFEELLSDYLEDILESYGKIKQKEINTEMLEMLIDIKDYLGSDKRQEVEQLIKKATL